MRITRFTIVTLIGAVLAASGCQQSSVAVKHHPAKVDSTEVKGIMKVTLEARAAERIGLQTVAVQEEKVQVGGAMATRKVVPYGAVMYDTMGDTWTFTSPSSLTFVRHAVVVQDIVGDKAILTDGPPAGTLVVTVGAAELMAVEHNYGR
jgi:hypothetical protein